MATPTRAAADDPTKGWNWGAFWLTWIWGLGNNVWIALLALIPFVGIVMAFVLGAKGNEWAWKAKEWKSVEDFRKTQKTWSIIGWILGGLAILALVVGILLSVFVLKATEAPVDVSREFVSDMQANRLDEALNDSSTAFKAATTKASLERVAKIQQERTTGEFKVTDRKIESTNGATRATVEGTVKGKSGSDAIVTLTLLKEGDRWVVQYYNIE